MAWDLTGASYDSVSKATGVATVRSLYFKPDGTRLFMLAAIGSGIYKYDLSTAWDLSSAGSGTLTFSHGGNNARGLFFKSDGTKAYIVDPGTDRVDPYTLSTPWDGTSATYDGAGFSVAGQDGLMSGIYFKPDGTKMYLSGQTSDAVYRYSLSTAWDVTTASYDNSFSVGAEETTPWGLFLKDDGTKMWVVGPTSDKVHQYSLSTAWDVTTASYDSVALDVSAQNTAPQGITFKDDGTKAYVLGTTSPTTFFQYTTGSAGGRLVVGFMSLN